MSTQIQRRRGTTAQHSTFTGANAELTVDTDKEVVVVHDGTTAGGYPLMRENASNSALALGSAAAPSLKWDANTGIYSPGADQLAVATNGVGRLFVDASGNVGIATASPGTKFHVNGPVKIGEGVATNTSKLLVNTLAGTAAGIQLFQDATESWIIQNPASSADLTFGASGNERLRITSAGLVGVGTSAPTGTLHLKHATDANIFFRNGSSAGLSTGTILECFNDAISATTPLYARASQFQFGTDSAGTFVPRMTVTSGGLVGIGTTSVSSNLDVRGSGAVYSNIGSTNAGGAYLFLDGNANGDAGGGDYAQIAHLSGGELQINNLQAQPLTFRTSNTERARIDSSGRLLVGTSTARSVGAVTAPVEIEGTTYATSSLSITCNSTSDAPLINLGRSKGASLGSVTGGLVAGDDLGYITFGAADGSTLNSRAAWIQCQIDGATGTTDVPGRLVFSTTADGASSPTERMRIGADGLIRAYGLGNSIIAASAQAAGTTFAAIICRHSASSTTTGTTSFQVMTNGDAQNTNNSYGAISDIKLKENIVDANSQWDDLKALQVRNYNFKEGQTHTQIGLVAQEVELVSPGLVTESPDRDEYGNDLGTVTKSINYSVLYMKAVKALQEAMERIEQLEAEVAALKAQ